MEQNVLAFDLGASSGRAILGGFDGERLTLREVHRFDNNAVPLLGTLYWDVLALYSEIRQGLSAAARAGGCKSVGIDTWGVDFGLLDAHGALVQNPVHYRDKRTEGLIPEVEALVGENLYMRNGIQLMELNTIFQLYALAKYRPDVLAGAQRALLMPDLLGHFLCGEMTAEYSMASTTQLLDPHTKNWDRVLLNKIGVKNDLFPDVRPSGTALGAILPNVAEDTGLSGASVVSVAGHDTASAVLATPAKDEDFIYISCGTWSLFGTELATPVITEKSAAYNITNEGGFGGTIRFLKNIIGLWLIQETRRQYRREGLDYGYNDLEKHALAAKPFGFFIDPDAPEFVPPGNLPRRVREFCKRTGQGEPQSVGEIMRCIYESIAMKYRYAFGQLADCTGKHYGHIHMIGGGTKDNLLCSMAASSTGRPIMAGPIEATAIGNIAAQLITAGELSGVADARSLVRKSFLPVLYEPKDTAAWDDAYGRFVNVVGK